ncbi:GAF domain-containing hybrid sensor histidine kinase/response regulator [Flagellimonas pacifica]|uniref:histidine kinase n=1 Tax=Flagellimonas pacifica TaxID=1247520 RepID=A0A285MWT2_9FLAO|nr:GAF domain-containing hybrid sensor histidine kinase/response regulator [Allomuricauda parva]SNZ01634.1 GAF domain-containing protein [Allomuricauda parva]
MANVLPIPTNEKERLDKLQYYQILDTEAEEMFDDLTKLTAKILDVPTCLISLVDEDRQWFKSRYGMDDEQTARDISFCQYTIMETEILEVKNAIEDERFMDSPLVKGGPKIRFYAGAPLVDDDGLAIGALCAKDYVPRELDQEKRDFLELISKTAMKLIKLRREKLEAEKLSQVKDEFLSNMSHEIRTPLNAIIGFNDLLQKTPLNKQQKAFLDTLHISSQNLKVIINDILDFSKLENGKITLEERPISIARLVDHVIKLQTHVAREKGLKLFSNIDYDLPPLVMGDETRLIQIFINLVGNAIKFTDEGFVELKVISQADKDDRVLITFSIKDTGIGIPKEKLQAIFERFSQAENSTTRLYGGTGLGLNIVEMLVTLQNGEISVNSEYGKGSEFVVNIPFVITEDTETRTLIASEYHEPDAELFREARILLVEDNVHNQFLAETYFNRWGGDIEIAANGQKALDLIEKNKYDVILMDLQMPVMNGFDATYQIRKEKGLKIPIIGCSAHSLNSDKEQCLEAGMDDYIAKPYTEEELIQTTLKYYEKVKLNTKNNGVEHTNNTVFDDVEGIIGKMKNEYGENIIDELVELFLNNIPAKNKLLKQAIVEENLNEIFENAHYLSGSLGSLGFTKGNELCRKVETTAKEGKSNEAIKGARQIVEYLGKTIEKLQKL